MCIIDMYTHVDCRYTHVCNIHTYTIPTHIHTYTICIHMHAHYLHICMGMPHLCYIRLYIAAYIYAHHLYLCVCLTHVHIKYVLCLQILFTDIPQSTCAHLYVHQGLPAEMDPHPLPRVPSFSKRTRPVSDISQGLAGEHTTCVGELISPSSCSVFFFFGHAEWLVGS